MKYLVILGDGMADEPIESLGNKTPLEYADTPTMDNIAKKSEIGLVHTIPDGMKPGSDTANLSVLGYDPQKYYSGRSPLEALSIGVPMEENDIAIRCNIVTLSEAEEIFEQKTMIDHSASEISTEDCAILLHAVRDALENEMYQFYVGTSYRHCLIWSRAAVYQNEKYVVPDIIVDLAQPHDILGRVIGGYLPAKQDFTEMMKKSYEVLVNHPINTERKKQGLHPANCCWFWGAGTKPMLSPFSDKYHKRGAIISAVDLLKGIAIGAKMGVINVEGANGGLHTNYEGKAKAAVKAVLEDGYDFVYVHIEAPDEMGHQGSMERKIQAIEYLDSRIIRPIQEAMDASGQDYRMLVLPDHPTPICIRTHASDPVPYLLYDSTKEQTETWHYNEKEAKCSGHYIEAGHKLMQVFLKEIQK